MTNIKIKQVEMYHPQHAVNNDFYYKHFEEQGEDIKKFLTHMGRKDRYVINDDKENGLTMGIEASKRVLKKAKMSGQEIDMIVFSTQIPETTFPANAMYIHDAIQANQHTIIMDSNANCAGMTVAVEQASHYMKSNQHVKTALVVGSDYNTLISNPADAITFANYGDAAAAVILERTEEETGFIDSIYFTDSVNREKINFPEKGLSNVLRGNSNNKYIEWLPFNGDIVLAPTYEMLDTLLERNNLTPKDIKAYCLSQFALSNIKKVQEQFNLDDQQIIYVGDRFGYTGTSSPFIAMYEGVETDRICRGDYVVFWTIGAGYQLIAMLVKY